MTTKNSPLSVLKRQAQQFAAMMKAFERGEKIDVRFIEKLEAARANKSSVKVGIVMDDKIVTIDIAWETIAKTSEVALAEYVLDLMRETRATEGSA
jgi:hypothetical protein